MTKRKIVIKVDDCMSIKRTQNGVVDITVTHTSGKSGNGVSKSFYRAACTALDNLNKGIDK